MENSPKPFGTSVYGGGVGRADMAFAAFAECVAGDDRHGRGLEQPAATGASAFCRRHNIRTTYQRYWTGAQGQ